MPVFEVTGPDGQIYDVTAPDGASEADILTYAMNNYKTAKPPEAQNSLAGSAAALGVGAGKGVIGLAALPALAAEWGAKGYDALTGAKTSETIGPAVRPFGAENIQKLVEGYTGEFRKPQTETEKYLEAIGGMAPAMIGGPGGVISKVATRMVAPGVASEAAGQAAEGTGYEPLARVGGALGGLYAGSKISRAVSPPKYAAVQPVEEIGAAKTGNYQSKAVEDLRFAPSYANKVSDRAVDNLARMHVSPTKNPDNARVFELVNGLRTPEFGATHRFADFDNTRRELNKIVGGQAGAAAQSVVRTIDAATMRFPKSAIVAGDPVAASREIAAGRMNAAAEFRSKQFTSVLDNARTAASSAHSGGNLENTIYQHVKPLLKKDRYGNRPQLRGWSPEAVAALENVPPGMLSSANVLRRTGKLLGGGGGLGQLMAGAGGAAAFGPVGMFAVPAVGMLANKLGTAGAIKRAKAVDELLRAQSALYGASNRAQRQRALARRTPTREQMAIAALLAGLNNGR
jgi:hypothetical protein